MEKVNLSDLKKEYSYNYIHSWVRKNKPIPDNCSSCKNQLSKENLVTANISGKYKKDVKDYVYLCRSCHETLDWDKDKISIATKARINELKDAGFWSGGRPKGSKDKKKRRPRTHLK